METTSLRAPLVRSAIEAINQGQLDDFMALFAPNAIVVDGSMYSGSQQIRDWAQRETFGLHVRFQLESEKNAEGTIITGHVKSVGGYAGPATFAFTLHADKIQRLVIS